jgi:hypothetical protein
VKSNSLTSFPHIQLEKIFFLFPDPHFKRSKHNCLDEEDAIFATHSAAYEWRRAGLSTVTLATCATRDGEAKIEREMSLCERESSVDDR